MEVFIDHSSALWIFGLYKLGSDFDCLVIIIEYWLSFFIAKLLSAIQQSYGGNKSFFSVLFYKMYRLLFKISIL